ARACRVGWPAAGAARVARRRWYTPPPIAWRRRSVLLWNPARNVAVAPQQQPAKVGAHDLELGQVGIGAGPVLQGAVGHADGDACGVALGDVNGAGGRYHPRFEYA